MANLAKPVNAARKTFVAGGRNVQRTIPGIKVGRSPVPPVQPAQATQARQQLFGGPKPNLPVVPPKPMPAPGNKIVQASVTLTSMLKLGALVIKQAGIQSLHSVINH